MHSNEHTAGIYMFTSRAVVATGEKVYAIVTGTAAGDGVGVG